MPRFALCPWNFAVLFILVDVMLTLLEHWSSISERGTGGKGTNCDQFLCFTYAGSHLTFYEADWHEPETMGQWCCSFFCGWECLWSWKSADRGRRLYSPAECAGVECTRSRVSWLHLLWTVRSRERDPRAVHWSGGCLIRPVNPTRDLLLSLLKSFWYSPPFPRGYISRVMSVERVMI